MDIANSHPREPVSESAQAKRFHGLDGVRAIAMLLGITLHISLSFVKTPITWAIQDQSAHITADLVALALHPFRLSVFFFAAGFFAHLLYHRRGFWGFAWHRGKRILLPLIVAWIVLVPPLVVAWGYGYVKTQLALGIPLQEITRPESTASGSIFDFPRFPLMHLWFLYYLLVLYAGVLGVRWFALRFHGNGESLREKADVTFRRLLKSEWRVPLLAIPTVVFLMGMGTWGIDTPEWSLAPDIPVCLLYGWVLSLGWLLHRQPVLLSEFKRKYGLYFVLGCALFVAMVWVLVTFQSNPDHRFYFAIKLSYMIMYALYMWLMIFSMIGFFEQFADRPNPKLRYISDSSYWLYLVHLPLIIVFQVFVAYWDLWWWAKFFLIHLVSIPLLLLSYQVMVRKTWIGAWLNGRRYGRAEG